MKVVIFGPRDLSDKELLKEAIRLSGFKITEVVSGGAKGIDALGEEYSLKVLKKEATLFPADWNTHGKAAGMIRNAKMAEYADCGIGINYGTAGTLNMIEQLIKRGKPRFTLSDAYEFRT